MNVGFFDCLAKASACVSKCCAGVCARVRERTSLPLSVLKSVHIVGVSRLQLSWPGGA